MVRRGLGLIAAAGVLVLLIVFLGDLRRAENVMVQAKKRANELQIHFSLGKDDGLATAISKSAQAGADLPGVRFDYRSAESVSPPLTPSKPFVAAVSRSIPRVVLPDGHAVILFDGSTFQPRWMLPNELDRLLSARPEPVTREP